MNPSNYLTLLSHQERLKTRNPAWELFKSDYVILSGDKMKNFNPAIDNFVRETAEGVETEATETGTLDMQNTRQVVIDIVVNLMPHRAETWGQSSP